MGRKEIEENEKSVFCETKNLDFYFVKASFLSNRDKRWCHLTVCDERRPGAAGNVMQWVNQVK